MVKISDTYSFDDYYLLVIDNISKKLLTRELKEKTKDPLLEFIHDMYYKEISPSTAILAIESFYSNFRKFINTVE